MNTLLWRSLWRHLTRHPWQLALAVIGIALGVAVVLAVDLANASARKSFALSIEQIGGRATHQIRGGSQGIPESLYLELRLVQGVRTVAPMVSGHAVALDPPRKGFSGARCRSFRRSAVSHPARRHRSGQCPGAVAQ